MDEILKAVNALFDARSNGMLTSEEWEGLEAATQAAYGQHATAEWRTHDELNN